MEEYRNREVMLMFDIIDSFIIFLMDGFYQSIDNDLKRWTENLLEAIEEDNQENIDTSMKYIKNYRELMNDLTDENMDTWVFVGLLAEKYGFVRDAGS